MKILLLGANGQVGRELVSRLAVHGDVTTAARTAGADLILELAEPGDLGKALEHVRPNLIVNAAAYTAVDQAETDADLAHHINAGVPQTLGDWAAQHDALVLHYSTDYVFDGRKPDPYDESDPTDPIGVYGSSKLAGDQALLASGCAAIILRVSWVYGLHGRNFLLTMLRLMHERDELKIVDDQIGAPTWSRLIAQVTADVLDRIPNDRDGRHALTGTYHLAPAGSTSWFGFASAIRDRLGLDCRLVSIPTEQYPTPARRPMNSRMATEKLRATFGLTLPSWEQSLDQCLAELAPNPL